MSLYSQGPLSQCLRIVPINHLQRTVEFGCFEKIKVEELSLPCLDFHLVGLALGGEKISKQIWAQKHLRTLD